MRYVTNLLVLFILHLKSRKKHQRSQQRKRILREKLKYLIVRLVKIKDNFLFVKDIDMVDGTPLLDIKPYLTSSHHIF
ncbi:MAG TPA: hypothetical protein ENG81_03140 [Candidatus Bathyarchaeota archaeon]|nr:hypothetical protein [Candidatus Bathyarchaeota archaeon]